MTDKDKVAILDTPEQIQTFGLKALYKKLEMEVKYPDGPRWRQAPSVQVRQILGVKTRVKAKLLEQFKAHLIKEGILKDE